MRAFVSDADANGDISGDDQSINSDHHEANDENSMDSERGGALNLVSSNQIQPRYIKCHYVMLNSMFIQQKVHAK